MPSRGVVDSSCRALTWLVALRLLMLGQSLPGRSSDQMAVPISVPHMRFGVTCASPRRSALSDITHAHSSVRTRPAPADYAVWPQSPESTTPPAPPHCPLSTAVYAAARCCPSDTHAGSVQQTPPPP